MTFAITRLKLIALHYMDAKYGLLKVVLSRLCTLTGVKCTLPAKDCNLLPFICQDDNLETPLHNKVMKFVFKAYYNPLEPMTHDM